MKLNTKIISGKLQCGVYKPTKVISASYGECEQDLPYDYTARQCNEFMKLGLQGVSITIASGDYGVASSPGDGGPNGCLGPEGKIFNPQYPSNCPYVTSVGGTQLYADQTVLDKESVMQVNLGGSAANFSSSGGFSNYFPQIIKRRPWLSTSHATIRHIRIIPSYMSTSTRRRVFIIVLGERIRMLRRTGLTCLRTSTVLWPVFRSQSCCPHLRVYLDSGTCL